MNKLVQDNPRVSEYESLMAATQMSLGQLYLIRGWYEEAETALKEAGRIYGTLVRGQPEVLPEYRQSLPRSHAILGHVYYGRAQAEQAETAQQKARQIFERLAQAHPDVLEYACDVGRCNYALAQTADRGGRTDAALARYGKAIEVMEGAMGKGYLAARSSLVGARINRAAALAGRGDHVRATEEGEAVAGQGDLRPGHLYDVACVFSRSSAAVDHDTKLLPANRTRLKAHYADRGMDFLRQAIPAGWHNPRVMSTDTGLNALRAREEFQKLLADLERKTKE